MGVLDIVEQYLGVGAATIYQSIFQRTFWSIELTAHDAIENWDGGFHAGRAAEATDGGNTCFPESRIQRLGQSGDGLPRARTAQSQQGGSLLPSAGCSSFVNSHIEQSAEAKTIQQRRKFVSRRHLDVIEQNRFNDGAIERIESPVPGGDLAGENFVPLRAQGDGALVSSAEVASAVPASQHDESNQEKDSD